MNEPRRHRPVPSPFHRSGTLASAALLPFLLAACGASTATPPPETPPETAPAVAAATPAAAPSPTPAPSTTPAAPAPEPEDPYLWLEDIDGDRALAWVREHNDATMRRLGSHPLYQPLYRDALAALNSASRIPTVSIEG